jgi:hypothetical protein
MKRPISTSISGTKPSFFYGALLIDFKRNSLFEVFYIFFLSYMPINGRPTLNDREKISLLTYYLILFH